MKKISARLDHQIIAFTICLILFSSLCVFFVNYYITYNGMLGSLLERSNQIHAYVQQHIDSAAIQNSNSSAEQYRQTYIKTKELLENTRAASNASSIYAVKQRADGTLIYYANGLSEDHPGFKVSGSSIEIELSTDLKQALEGQTILPRSIKDTSWGQIFISYYPIRNNQNEIIGALGIEYDAKPYVKVQNNLRNLSLATISILCLFGAFLALTFFKGKTAFIEQQAFTIDELTNLPNRKAFIQTIKIFSRTGSSIITADLNHLKEINRRYGNQVGDECIKKTCGAISSQMKKNHALYRIGSDEFLMLLPNTGRQETAELVEKINHQMEIYIHQSQPLSLSFGCALYDPAIDHDLFDTYIRADEQRYKYKELSRKKASAFKEENTGL